MERWLAAEADSHDADKVRMQQLEKEIRQLRKEKADLEDIDTALCQRTQNAAIRRHRPGAALIHHSDQGSQYTSQDYQNPLKKNHIVPSMIHKGIPYDNACAESFFSTIKL